MTVSKTAMSLIKQGEGERDNRIEIRMEGGKEGRGRRNEKANHHEKKIKNTCQSYLVG